MPEREGSTTAARAASDCPTGRPLVCVSLPTDALLFYVCVGLFVNLRLLFAGRLCVCVVGICFLCFRTQCCFMVKILVDVV